MPTISPAIDQFISATDSRDRVLFLNSFTADASLDDWGRTFTGREAIGRWSDGEHIGVNSSITVHSFDRQDDTLTLNVSVSGGGYNGDGVFIVHERDGLIAHLTIR